MAGATEAAILEALRANEGLGLGHARTGLMTKEVAERARLSLGDAQTALNDMANRGLVHRSTFYWYSGADPNTPDEPS